jgi:protein kinase C substrate 80K-H
MLRPGVEHHVLALYLNIIDHHNALEYLQGEVEKYRKAEKKLGEILDALRRGYNPNYQDMAVLEAVRGWEKHADLPHINDVGKEGEAAEEEKKETKTASESSGEEVWTEEMLQKELKALLDTDFDSLLVDEDEYNRSNEVDEDNRESSVLVLGDRICLNSQICRVQCCIIPPRFCS